MTELSWDDVAGKTLNFQLLDGVSQTQINALSKHLEEKEIMTGAEIENVMAANKISTDQLNTWVAVGAHHSWLIYKDSDGQFSASYKWLYETYRSPESTKHLGEFSSLEKAIRACKKIIRKMAV